MDQHVAPKAKPEDEPEVPESLLTKPVEFQTQPREVPIAPETHATERKISSTLKWLLTGAAVLFVVVAINLWGVGIYTVDGESMTPTLNNEDKMLVLKAPQAWAELTRSLYIPKRHDVVIVRESDGAYVKRVVGISGDRIVIKNSTITVFNETSPTGADITNPPCCANLAELPDNIDITIQPGHIFVVGDNRTNGGSIDSRSKLGQIPASDIVGRSILRLNGFTLL